ncbi:flippase [Sutcliffiella horikoshii]|uniref:flippase n=1 Tax=Sutcliffiella horikoshii TaxID=79883 RepID=UPI00203E6E87|nr:flippase [Sutcliffiella horikoshii]MCM3617920.1 flippase [Sutcliffiella horikoshii]
MKFQEKINQFKKNEVINKIVNNSSWLIGDKVFSMLIGVYVLAMIARYLGPESYGQFNYALAFVALFTALSTLGLETLAVKAVIYKEEKEGTILCTSLVLRLIGGCLVTLIATIVIILLEPDDSTLHLLVLTMSLTMVFKSLEVIEYWVQAYQKSKITSIIRMFTTIVSAGLKLCFVIWEGSLIHLALIYTIDSIIIGIALIIAYYIYREEKSNWRFNWRFSKNILSQSSYLILSGLMVTLYMKIDQIMLGSMLPTKVELGVYSAAIQVAAMWYFIPMSIITSFKPVIMNNKKTNNEKYLKSIQILYTIVTWSGIVFGIFILLFSNKIIVILFGIEYLKAASILTISIWGGIFAMLGTARGTWLICEGLQKYTVIYIGAGAMVNVILNYFLIPTLGGFGAAIATLASQLTVAIIAPLFVKKTRVSAIMMLKSLRMEGIR